MIILDLSVAFFAIWFLHLVERVQMKVESCYPLVNAFHLYAASQACGVVLPGGSLQ